MAVKIHQSVKTLNDQTFRDEISQEISQLFTTIESPPQDIEVTVGTVKFIWTSGLSTITPDGRDYHPLGLNLHISDVSADGIGGNDLGSIWTTWAEGQGASLLIAQLPRAAQIREQLIEWLRTDEAKDKIRKVYNLKGK
jgi:hypothetical protein